MVTLKTTLIFHLQVIVQFQVKKVKELINQETTTTQSNGLNKLIFLLDRVKIEVKELDSVRHRVETLKQSTTKGLKSNGFDLEIIC